MKYGLSENDGDYTSSDSTTVAGVLMTVPEWSSEGI